MNSMKDQRSGGFLITKIHQLGGRIFTKLLKKHELNDINPAQGRILFPLWKKDGISINELSKETLLVKSTLTTMLDRLEELGYLKRVHSVDDRRKTLIYLTDKDKELQSAYHKVSEEMTRIYYKDFTEEEIDRTEEYLSRILENLYEFKSKL